MKYITLTFSHASNISDPELEAAVRQAFAEFVAQRIPLSEFIKRRYGDTNQQTQMAQIELTSQKMTALDTCVVGETRLAPKPQFYPCGVCDCYHNTNWNGGDCREDKARFNPEDLDTRYGAHGWDEVPMPGGEELQPAWLRRGERPKDMPKNVHLTFVSYATRITKLEREVTALKRVWEDGK